MLKLMYMTNREDIALIAEKSGVDWILVDLEIRGKEKRQGHLDTAISRHHIEDVQKIKRILTYGQLIVRINPIYEGSKDEIDKVIKDGADIVMLPYFQSINEVKFFLDAVDGRSKVCLLLETPAAVENLDSILEVQGIDYIHIGINDLHLGYKKTFMFELLSDGTVEKLCNKIKSRGIMYGFGGIGKIGYDVIPAEYIITEHYRLGSDMAIIARSFCNTNLISNLNEVKEKFDSGISEIRNLEYKLQEQCDASYFQMNQIKVNEIVKSIVESIKENKDIKKCSQV